MKTTHSLLERIAMLSAVAGLALCSFLSGCGSDRQAASGDAVVRAAWEDYRLGEFSGAVRAFERVVAENAPGAPLRLQGLYGLATTWNLRRPGEDTGQAARLYEQLVSEGPRDELSAWSLLALARMKHLVPVGQEPDYEAVRAAYQRVLDGFPTHPAAEEAFLRREATFLLSPDPRSLGQVEADLLTWLAQHPASGLASAAYNLLGSVYRRLEQPEKELAARVQALDRAEVDPENPRRENSGSYWYLASLAEFGAGDFATARLYYRRLIDEYPQDIRIFPAREALKRMDRLEAELAAAIRGPEGRQP